ncbi:dihydrofolate reductase family protein [Jannaschia marina]|uniref:dihydrofolate reductase family protein n=1 Tax=Jannaschia marina TaxID=2741674 RepID=UPI0015C94F83|nr:dihydrofolate reductase family protein [Jannaschia marina]
MHPIIYDVAVSLDGYIAGPAGDISRFAHDGPVVDDYRARLAGYTMALMGRETYTFGYRFGLSAGENPYPHMRSIVVSETLDLPDAAAVEQVFRATPDVLRRLKAEAPGPIYLCGGGRFAGALLAAGMIDRLVLKRAPVLLGGGTPLFDTDGPRPELTCRETQGYADGYLLQVFDVAA